MYSRLLPGRAGTMLSLLLLFIAADPVPSLADTAPNILFILCDDLGYGDLGCFFQNGRAAANRRNEPWHLTPGLDTMAEEGVQMRRHYCPAAVCAPSRASLLLGVHQGHANVRDNQFDKELEDNHTLATMLRQAGYATAVIGKWGLQGSGSTAAEWPAYPTKRGFDYFLGYVRHGDGHTHYPYHTTYTPGTTNETRPPKEVWENDSMIRDQLANCYTTDLFTARAKKWITDRHAADPDQPFFLYLAYDTPHAALQVPTMAYPAGGGTNGGVQWVGTPGHMINTAVGPIDTFVHPDYATATWDHDDSPGTEEQPWPEVYQRYATMVRRLDDSVTDLIRLLKDLGIDDRTLIVFTSDNGPSIEDYLTLSPNYAANFFDNYGPHDGIKRDTWEGGVRMAALARWPGTIPAGRIDETASAFWDWMPTFAEMAGVPPPARTDGVSLMPTLTGVGTQRPGLVYIEYNNSTSTPNYTEFEASRRGATRRQMQAIHVDGYKGVRYNITSHAKDFEIYETRTDPKEATNLAGSNPWFVRLQQRMKDRVLQVRRPDNSAARPYDTELVPAMEAIASVPGLAWRSFEGSYPWLPDYSVLAPAATGQCSGLDLSVRPRDENVGLEFTGFLNVPADGSYTLYLSTDGRAAVRLHDATVIDADFGYAPGTDRTGSILLKAGLHPIRISYYRMGGGTPELKLDWSGDSFAREPVPATQLQREGTLPPGPPQAVDDAAVLNGGSQVDIAVLANDYDDGTPAALSIQSLSQPGHGVATRVGDSIRYQPRAGFFGSDRFAYTITDGQDTATADVLVDVRVPVGGELWFPFSEGQGLVTAEAGGAPIGSLNGYPDGESPWVSGRFNQALRFDGSSQYVAVDASYVPPAASESRTLMAWIKAAGPGAIVSWGTSDTAMKWHFRIENATPDTGALRIEVSGGYKKGKTDLRDGQWHHVALVFANDGSPDVTDCRLYVDGKEELPYSSDVKSAAVNTAATPMLIGLDSQNRYFPGVIDELKILRRALVPSEIAAAAVAGRESAEAWHYRALGRSSTGDAEWGVDANGDGVVRAMEYALGGSPHKDSSGLSPVIHRTGTDAMELVYNRRRAGTHELTYAVEQTSNLVMGPWVTVTNETVLVPHPRLGPDFEEVGVPLDTVDRDAAYLRVTAAFAL